MDQHLSVLRRATRLRRWYMAVGLAILNLAAFHAWLCMRMMMPDGSHKANYYLRFVL
jgi:hypothetical protein